MNNNPHDDWERLFEEVPLDVTARDEYRDHLKSRVLDALKSHSTPQSQQLWLADIGRILMTYKALYWTAAAILVACAVWFFEFSGGPAFALDEVVERFAKARTARYDMTVTFAGQPSQQMKAYYLEPSHFRQELANGYINVADWQAGKMVGLDPNTKRATVFNVVNVPDEAKGKMNSNQFEMIRDMLRKAIEDPKVRVESLGEKKVGDRQVVGFRLQPGTYPLTMWVDPGTRFPVRIEATMAGPPKTDVLMVNYEFNIDLDESLFSVEIPDDYEVMESDVDASRPTEADLITSLRMCYESFSGEFPSGLDQVSVGKYAAMYVQKLGIDTDQGPNAEQMQQVMKLARGFQFVMTLTADSEAQYAGAKAKQGDTDRAIFSYKPTDSDAYRVIYADFSVKEANVAPDMPGAVKLTQ